MRLVLAGIILASTAIAGCGSVDVPPRAAINDSIESAIVAAGGHPADWVFDNDCVINGSCTATLASAEAPDAVVATNRYVARDSRDFLKGEDKIAAVVGRAYARNCLNRFESGENLIRCIN
ncbi:MAG: hypothetical protein H6532_04925 [Thermoleophilales bacterium]|nr:hypothetical protein [Thermoleophilales bacterium]